MATTLKYDLTYDAPIGDVGEMLMEPAFREQVLDAQRSIRRSVSITDEGGGMKVLLDSVIASTGMPGFARKFVGDEINLVQTEHWTDLENGTVEVDIPGKPGQMSGTIRLTGDGESTTETVEMTIKVPIPLVGGRIESLVSDLLRKALTIENTVGRSYLTS